MADHTIDLYLDFDGVINIVQSPKPDYADLREGEAAGWKLQWRQGVIDFINDLPENIRLVWLTTWEHSNLAETLLVPLLGITRPTITIRRTNTEPQWWKAYALEAWRKEQGIEHRKFIWIDDDLGSALRDPLDVPQVLRGTEGLRISPRMSEGITEDDMENIKLFIALESRLHYLQSLKVEGDIFPATDYAVESLKAFLNTTGLSYPEEQGFGIFADLDNPGGIRIEWFPKQEALSISFLPEPDDDLGDAEMFLVRL